MSRRSSEPGEAFLILDLETRPDPHALALMRQASPSRVPATAHMIASVSLLSMFERADGEWHAFKLDTATAPACDEPAMLDLTDQALAAVDGRGGTCVTFNGLSHDLGVLRRRAARHLMFDAAGIHGARDMKHVDLMRTVTRGWRDDWPSLRAACAGLGIPVNHMLVDKRDAASPPRRKGETDVACTFLLMLYELAIARGSPEVLARGWAGLSAFIVETDQLPHLAQFARAMPAALRRPA